ncbi:hypothetical protein HETIRDRAFT_329766 [Heterobasidion irregulare TC 32-1]|uniref:Uncharacterized protein n=1 Tax=Heterobasidion irregulare (strain TC 32-1) TaxID=747525 RepID=W4JRE0_HETIT|nr:uncharacterized protein HETIRDRAFT_329766 [Heterobasidion irregulare TC 32-1]ETW76108.1 hypothetical protein HETIRDRAFT_329766 [Heterobasidion irregulare TC 32-1]
MGIQYSCRGWDGLFNKCGKNLNSLVTLKLSLYHKAFDPSPPEMRAPHHQACASA